MRVELLVITGSLNVRGNEQKSALVQVHSWHANLAAHVDLPSSLSIMCSDTVKSCAVLLQWNYLSVLNSVTSFQIHWHQWDFIGFWKYVKKALYIFSPYHWLPLAGVANIKDIDADVTCWCHILGKCCFKLQRKENNSTLRCHDWQYPSLICNELFCPDLRESPRKTHKGWESHEILCPCFQG